MEKKTITRKLLKGCSIKSVTIRETDGRDEAIALKQAEIKGNPSLLIDELMRLSVVKVDGKPAEQPLDIDSWNTRTRLLVKALYSKLNSVEDVDAENFLAGEDLK